MKKILKNEQTNEQTNERASERIEQKFMNEIRLEKLKKIRFSGTKIGCSGNFYKILGIAINYISCEKTRIIKKKSNENVLKRRFPAFSAGKVFLKNRTRPCFGHCYYAFLNKKSVKTDDEISSKRQKTGFAGKFPACSAGKVH